MAKTRKPTQKQMLARSLITYATHRIDCCICGEEDTCEDMGEKSCVDSLYSDGWRYATSDKCGVEGSMCPKCFETPDADRGE